MIERHGTHVCPECGREFTWSVFLRKKHMEAEQKTIDVSARCLYCGTEQKWKQRISEET